MQLITTPEQPSGCRHCQHYYFLLRPEERFPHGCLAMKYIGKTPAASVVLEAGPAPCPLFSPRQRPAP